MKSFDRTIFLKVMFIGIVIFVMFEMIVLGFVSSNKQSAINDLRPKAETIRAQIEKVFQSTITISDGYLSYMTSNLDASKEDTETFLNHLFFYDENYVKNIAVIEDTTIKFNYPYEENQSSIGVDLSTIATQRDDILMVKNSQEPLFIGPVELVQGGLAFILRIPILDGDSYWGQIAVVLDADLFIQSIKTKAELNSLTVRIFEQDSDFDLFINGDVIDDENISTNYSNKYFSWTFEVSESEIQSTLVQDIIIRLIILSITFTICYFLYKSNILNKRIMHNANHDSLTGDYNRSKFISDYNSNLFEGMLIAFSDVNKFKLLNDTLGHSFGDWCLKQLSSKFNSMNNLRTYRIGGDEFILVSTAPMSVEEFENQLSSNIFTFYNEEFKQDVDLALSIGILEKITKNITLESMLMYLDYAMYDAKKENRSFTIVDNKLMKIYDETKVIEQQLIEDIRKNNLLLFYQPIINLETCAIEGFEVLSRWLYKDKIRTAAKFIDIVKKIKYVDLVDINLFNKLQTEYVELLNECSQIKDLSFAINLSAESLMIFEKTNKKFDGFVENRVIPTKMIVFEISEDMNLGTISMETLRYIQNKGYAISVDDFGSGVTKLSDVLSGELRTIKTDKSLLPSKKENDKKTAGFLTVINAIKASGSAICVEGVETTSQLELSIEAGCKLAQGYLFCKPIPKDEIIDYIKNFDFSNYIK
ncbi:EAL domain-containing protein [Mycoplasmatota bacterium WC30]